MAHKFLILLVFLGIIVPAYSQINGGYYWWNSMGQSFLYFQGKNVSGRTLKYFKVTCVNERLHQRMSFNFTNVANKKIFTIGPGNGWVWQNGEKIYIDYGGKRSCWVCNIVPSQNTYIPSCTPSYNNDSYTSNYYAIMARIRQYEYKLRDAERSLRLYQEWNDRNPSISGTNLIISQQQLVWTYRQCIQNLLMQLR